MSLSTAILESVNVNGFLNVLYDTSFNGNLLIKSTTNSTSSTTGALVVKGGGGFNGNVNINGNIFTTSIGVNKTTIKGGYGLDVSGSINISGNVTTVLPLTTASDNQQVVISSATSSVGGALTYDIDMWYNPASNLFKVSNIVVNQTTLTSGCVLDVSGNVRTNSSLYATSIGVNKTSVTALYVLDINGSVIVNSVNNLYNKLLVLLDQTGTGDPLLTATNFYGFGINSGLLRYQVASGGAHVFFGGTTEYMRITNTGVGIGIGTTPSYALDVNGSMRLNYAGIVANKLITLYDLNPGDPVVSATNFCGFGSNSYILRYQVPTGYNHVFYGAANEYMRLDSNGNLGIGTTPSYKLDVSGTIRSSTQIICGPFTNGSVVLNVGTSTQAGFIDFRIGATRYGYIGYLATTTNYLAMQVENGYLGYECNGILKAVTFSASSDYRLKNNIQPLKTNTIVDLLNPVEYDLSGGKHDMGFLAHEVQEVFPFLVQGEKDGKDMQSINYTGFIPLLVKEVQDLKKENKILKENKLKQVDIINSLAIPIQTFSNIYASITLPAGIWNICYNLYCSYSGNQVKIYTAIGKSISELVCETSGYSGLGNDISTILTYTLELIEETVINGYAFYIGESQNVVTIPEKSYFQAIRM